MNFSLLLALLLLSTTDARARPPVVTVRVLEPVKLMAGASVQARVLVAVAEGYHLQANPASEAYLIEDGHITAPVKGATLIGDGPTVLRQVTAVGNDLKLDHGVGICGKEGQTIPVSVGLPTIKIREITVGGTEK